LRYLPKSQSERQEMLEACGFQTAGELYAHIPAEARLNRPLNMANGVSEYEILDYFKAQSNKTARLPPSSNSRR